MVTGESSFIGSSRRRAARSTVTWPIIALAWFTCLALLGAAQSPAGAPVVAGNRVPVGSPAVGQRPITAADVLASYSRAAGAARLRALRGLAAVGDVLQPSASTTVFSFRFVGPASFQSVEILPPGADSPARVYTIDGGSAWCRGEAKGTAPVGAEGMDAARRVLVQSRRRLLEIVLGTVPELAANGKVVMFTYAGLELDPDGKRQLVALDVADDAGSFGRLFFRTDTHLPARLVTRFMMTVGRAEMATRTLEFDDYRSVDGIMLPFSIARRGGGYRVTISHYTLNPDLPDGLFAAPTTPQGLRRIIDAMR